VNPEQFETWKNAALREVIRAIAASPQLRAILIFKGARVLNQWLETERVSLDLDSNLSTEFAVGTADLQAQAIFLEAELERALQDYLRNQRTVRYTLEGVRVVSKHHPFQWHGHQAKIRLRDAEFAQVLGMPPLELDISAPEKMSVHAVRDLAIDHSSVRAYTLERIAGEKLRAFLSTLPAYRMKVKKPGEAIRVKDLYDLVRIYRARSIRDTDFWEKVGVDFRLACESRFIDCAGLATFQENWPVTRELFEADRTLPKNVRFDEVEMVLVDILQFMTQTGVVPFAFQLNAVADQDLQG